MKKPSTRTRCAGPSARSAYDASLPMVNSPPGIHTIPDGAGGGRLKSRVAANAAANAARANPAMIRMRLMGAAEYESDGGSDERRLESRVPTRSRRIDLGSSDATGRFDIVSRARRGRK